MTTSRHIRASYEPTTCFCWRHWTSSSQDLSINCTRSTLSVQWKETTSRLRRRRSERTRSYCQRSVASLLNSSNCSSMHWTTVDSNMSATSSLDLKVYNDFHANTNNNIMCSTVLRWLCCYIAICKVILVVVHGMCLQSRLTLRVNHSQ